VVGWDGCFGGWALSWVVCVGSNVGIFAPAKIPHLIDDETVAKMGPQIVVVQ
jgi:hypothetical protein